VRIVSGLQLSRLLGDWRGTGSAYETLAGAVTGLVRDGRLPAGARLPAERELAGSLEISRTTVAAAYERLRADGYLRSRRGSGSVITLPRGQSGGRAAGWVPTTSPDGVLDLAIAAMPATQPIFGTAAQAALDLLPDYSRNHGYDSAGLPELREELAAGYRRRGVPTAAEEILVTSGAQHGLDLLLRLLCRPGERVLMECPTYPNALAAVSGNNCRVVPVGLGDADWDVELFSDTMRQSTPTLTYLIPEFQNPTGWLMPAQTRRALAEVARRTGSYLVSDESFVGLTFGATEPGSLASFDGGERVICLGSMSKRYWGGLRIGWIRANAPLIRRLADLRAVVDMSQPVLEQLIACQLLAAGPAAVAQRCRDLESRRDALVGAVRETFPDWSFFLPQGGMALWVRLEAPVSSALSAAARRHGVVVAPGPRFGAAASMENYLRIPYTLSENELVEAVGRLERAHTETFQGGTGDPQVHVA
jgi:DNA-binding transcriptional MocR family regulator